jgi:hypothetical protein
VAIARALVNKPYHPCRWAWKFRQQNLENHHETFGDIHANEYGNLGNTRRRNALWDDSCATDSLKAIQIIVFFEIDPAIKIFLKPFSQKMHAFRESSLSGLGNINNCVHHHITL